MRNTQMLFALVLVIVTLAVPVGGQPGESDALNDELLIRESIVELYVKGLRVRDFELIRTICIPEAVLMGIGDDDKLHVTSLDKWESRFDPNNPPFQSLDYSILKIDAVGTAAQVKILFIVDGSRRVTDFLNLLKLEGRWRVVNIIDF